MSDAIPMPVWTHGTDPDGAEYYSCHDPTDPTMRCTVTSMAVYGRRRWHVDYVAMGEWWWTRGRRWSLPHGATAQDGMREAVRWLYGARFGEWLSQQQQCPSSEVSP